MQKARPGYKLVKSLFGKYEEIPEEWNFKKLGDVGEIVGGGTPESNKEEFWNGDVLWAVPTDITKQSSKFINDTERRISEKGLKESSAKLLPEGTLLITTRATIGECSINTKPISTNQGFQNLICNEENFNEFWYYSIKYHKKRLLRLSYGTTFLEISKSGITQVSIPTTNSKKEQKKIASILSSVDDLINHYDKAIESTTRLKKGLMQKLLTKGIGHKKFKKVKWLFGKEIEIPEEWTIMKLDNISKIIDSLHITPSYSSEGIPMVRSTEIKYGNLKLENALRVTKEVYEKFTKNHKPTKNDIVMSRVGTYFVTSFVDTEESFCIGQNTLAIHPKINPRYLYYSMNFSYVEKQIEINFDRTTGQKTLSLQNIRNLKIFVPNNEEQQKISEMLKDIHTKITELESKKTNLEKLKKGLMQKLLTGQIRVKI